MRLLHHCCCGIDVHRSFLSANLRRYGEKGKKSLNEVRTFGTMTHELLSLKDWLKEAGCTHISIESTGVFWKPIFNILGNEFKVILVNSRHVKALPGRKTDVKDCQWLCELLQHGLLKASFIPPEHIRQLRDLTRQRKQLIRAKASMVNRVHKVLQDANIKLSSVITDIMGKSGQEMLNLIIQGETDVDKLVECARGRMRIKKKEISLALEGRLTKHHRFMLSHHMKQISFQEELIEEFNQQINEHIKSIGDDFFKLIALLQTIPGIDKKASEDILAEIGTDMNQFPSAEHLSSWAGVCPGNNETGGKRKSGKTTKGSRWLRAVLGETAWAASRTKETYLSAHYRRIARKRGIKRAIVATGHTMLVIIYHIIKNRRTYIDLGHEHFNTIDKAIYANKMVKRLQKLGYKVELTEKEEEKTG